MRFFLDEIVARIVGIWLCVSCSGTVWRGLVERKIAYFNDDIIGSLLIDWSKVIAYRDTTPIRYWIQIGLQISFVISGFFLAIFGWWRPDP